MKTFITSDTHFYHSKTITWQNMPRRYLFNSQKDIPMLIDDKSNPDFDKQILHEDCIRMNETLISNWNSVVGKDDEIYHLGDLAFASHKKIREIFERLNGKIHLIPGNHEKWKVLKKISDMFASVNSYKEIQHYYQGEKYHICMMHYPLATWNRAHYGTLMLHGHSHGAYKGINKNAVANYIFELEKLGFLDVKGDIVEALKNVTLNHGKCIDIGVDTDLANFYPILIDDVIEYSKGLEYEKVVDL